MARLRRALAATGGLLVAFSGGVDSAVLARLARDALGDRAVAVTVDSQTFTAAELREARRLARLIGIRHIVVTHDELAEEAFCRNPPDRCYLCRRGLAGKLRELASRLGIPHIADGANLSDTREHRPGIRAATEAGVLHPFIEHRVTKSGVRRLARSLGLPVAGRPSSACLSSRVPYGERITEEKLRQIERAESYIRSLGFRQVRVRHHGAVARIEVEPEAVPRLVRKGTLERVARRLRRLGFVYVTADLEGYRSGSLDKVLK
ncbi:MAG: ATP-dependent sacrificial sulfur transferase LarE [Euryarchaeota archaeon]|nr:ATP-dependent sacrificial sulfur transferase LarE [Euryarchaeota archaeon]